MTFQSGLGIGGHNRDSCAFAFVTDSIVSGITSHPLTQETQKGDAHCVQITGTFRNFHHIAIRNFILACFSENHKQ